jgi:hypothetical protein
MNSGLSPVLTKPARMLKLPTPPAWLTLTGKSWPLASPSLITMLSKSVVPWASLEFCSSTAILEAQSGSTVAAEALNSNSPNLNSLQDSNSGTQTHQWEINDCVFAINYIYVTNKNFFQTISYILTIIISN